MKSAEKLPMRDRLLKGEPHLVHGDTAQKRFQILSFLILACAYIGIVCFLNLRIDRLISADDASELVLGNLLASENRFLSKNWFYSTELRVLNTQIVFMLFFKLTGNWHLVRILSSACLFVVMLFTYYLLCKALGCSKNYFAITAALFLLPLSIEYFRLFLWGLYYIPHAAITFFSLALIEFYIKSSGKKRLFCFGLIFALSILAGMGGPRQLIILYFPLFLCAVLLVVIELTDQYKSRETGGRFKLKETISGGTASYALVSSAVFVGSLLGYGINTFVLSKQYHFIVWHKISYTDLSPERFTQILNGFLDAFGFSKANIFTVATLSNFLCVCWIALTVAAISFALKNRKYISGAYFRFALFTLCAYVVFFMLYLFTDQKFENRYCLPVSVLSIPLIAGFLSQLRWSVKTKNIAVSLLVLLVAVNGSLYYRSLYRQDVTAELREIGTMLDEEEYHNGYASFWSANVLTELSNGSIEVWSWNAGQDGPLYEINIPSNLFRWLQAVRHIESAPEGKVFLLFTEDEFKRLDRTAADRPEEILYQSDHYVVIGYESYEALLERAAQN